MVVIVGCIVTDSNDLHHSNTPLPRARMVGDIQMDVNEVHPAKALLSMVVMLGGVWMYSKEDQFQNAWL